MKKTVADVNEVAINLRRGWGEMRPYCRIHKSKKTYNRKDRSWRREE